MSTHAVSALHGMILFVHVIPCRRHVVAHEARDSCQVSGPSGRLRGHLRRRSRGGSGSGMHRRRGDDSGVAVQQVAAAWRDRRALAVAIPVAVQEFPVLPELPLQPPRGGHTRLPSSRRRHARSAELEPQ